MKLEVKNKIVILLVAFVLFLGGVLALSLERGPVRTTVLAGVFVALLCMAGVQTYYRLKKKEK